MAQALVALKSARVYLGDINGISWPDSILMPMLQEAHGELVQECERFSLSVILNQSAILLVNAGDLTLGANQPATLVEPISIMERIPGSDMESFEPMLRLTFIPLQDQSEELQYWAWLGQVITFLGATQDREILLRYKGSISTPNLLTDPLGFIFAERYIGPRVASIAWDSIGKDGSKFQKLAENQLYKIIQSNVTNDQRPVRRKGYRSSKNLYGPDGGSVIGPNITQQGAASVLWIPTTTPPDGVRTEFFFTNLPKYCSFNGANQFPITGYILTTYSSNIQITGAIGPGYLITTTAGTSTVTFRDVLGNVITPGVTDDIRAAIGQAMLGVPTTWTPTLTPPDGIRTAFNFQGIPSFISFNGLNQFPSSATTTNLGRFSVHFIDIAGNVLTPGATDDIRAEIN